MNSLTGYSLLKQNDRIFVAGHGGMVGSAICRTLHSSGYGAQADGGAILTAPRNELDLLDFAAVRSWFGELKPTVVVLAAAKVGGIAANAALPANFLLENLKIQNNVIENAWQFGVRRLLFLGSSCIYPKFAEQPIKEETLLSGALESTNEWYAIAKIAGLKLCEALRKQHGFDAISLMPTNLYGPGDNYHPETSHVLPAMIRRFHAASLLPQQGLGTSLTCWGSGKPRREFLHVDDLSEACLFALERWQPKASEPIHLNVGTGTDLSISELADKIAAVAGYRGTISWDSTKPDGTPKKQLDISRLAKLGWKARIPLEQGLETTYGNYLNEIKQVLDRN